MARFTTILRCRYGAAWPVVPAVALAAWLVLSVPAGGSHAAAPPDPPPGKAPDLVGCWSTYALPIVPGYTTAIADVDALSPSDVWTAGTQDTAGGGTRPRIHHWNGAEWSIVLSPTGSGSRTSIATIEAIAPNEVWAAGDSNNWSTSISFVLRWDGTSWTVQNTPDIGPINDISALSANDVWVISNSKTMHWNGISWTVHDFPTGVFVAGFAIKAVAPNDVWAGGLVGNSVPKMLRWDGTQWNTVNVGGPYGEASAFYDFAVIAPDDIWAVGRYTLSGSENRTLTAHWDGTSWTRVTSPNPPGYSIILEGVSAASTDDVWAVGDSYNAPAPSETVMMHWDGSAWTLVPAPAGATRGRLKSVLAVSATDVWAVGYEFYPIVLRYTDPCSPPSPTPTVLPTNTPTLTPWPTSTPTATPVVLPYCWTEVPAPIPSVQPSFSAVSASGPNDVWAVGQYYVSGYTYNPFTMHWDGTEWTQVPVPAGVDVELRDVVAIAPNDAWAVGRYFYSVYRTFTMHWNGSVWSVVPSPNIEIGPNNLNSVDAAGPNDVWAVGRATYPTPGGNESQRLVASLTMHWDGSAWTIVPAPGAGVECELLDVDVASSSEVWAVGRYFVGSAGQERAALNGHPESQPDAFQLILRWNGSSWQLVEGFPGVGGWMTSVEALSASDVWIGWVGVSGTHWIYHFAHWDGAQWVILPDPQVAPSDIEAAPSNDIWAVGNGLWHWNGSAWGRAELPQHGTSPISPVGVAVIAPNDVWAVGSYTEAGQPKAAILHYGPECAPTPTPVATATPNPPRCPQERFTDVCPIDYFYQPVLALSDLNIISGYSTAPPCDGPAHIPCFKPYNGSTRGQIAKVVSLAAGFSEPVSGQTFEDVLPGSPFWEYIERMASRDIIQGYPCGGEFEPCGPEYKPYFRPNNLVTRGQLSKMTAEAFGFSEPVSGQTFEDVPPTGTFYEWVQRIAARGIIQGYQCGGIGEPCGPEERPYFRPNNHVTRGQTAKIVHLAMLEPTPTPTATPSPGTTPSPTPSDHKCQGIPPSEYMEIEPGNCAPAGSNFSFTGTAFQPGEEVTAYSIDPYGQVFGGPHTLTADASGRAGPVAFNTLPDFLAGVWNMNMVGSTSGHHARGYFKLTPP